MFDLFPDQNEVDGMRDSLLVDTLDRAVRRHGSPVARLFLRLTISRRLTVVHAIRAARGDGKSGPWDVWWRIVGDFVIRRRLDSRLAENGRHMLCAR